MPSSRPAAGGGRWVDVPPERIERWIAGFRDRHGEATATRSAYGIDLHAADGAIAQAHVPFPPMPADTEPETDLLAHVGRPRRVGVLLVRLGGYAAGVFAGADLIESKVDSRLVHGRASAGGWSQKRFARRREGQARAAYEAAAAVAARILVPHADDLDAVVTGGERAAVDAVLSDSRLAALRPLVVERFLTTPDPKRAVLDSAPPQFRGVRIRVIDP